MNKTQLKKLHSLEKKMDRLTNKAETLQESANKLTNKVKKTSDEFYVMLNDFTEPLKRTN